MADPGPGAPTVIRLPCRPPLAAGPLLRFLGGHTVPGLERHDAVAGTHERAVRAPGGPAVVRVVLDTTAAGSGLPVPRDARVDLLDAHVDLHVAATDAADVPGLVARVRRWLDLDADPVRVDEALAADPLLRPLVRRRPGLRVPGAVDGVETALLAVLGQQVSLAAARTFAGRLVHAFGEPVPGGLHAFPAAVALAAVGPDEIRAATGVTGARARTVHAVASAAADGLCLEPGRGPDADLESERAAVRSALLALPGVGPWTAEYVALRVLRDPDAFPSGDLVLRRVLGVRHAREAEERARPWRPWRGYAVLHLWTEAVFGGP